MRFYRPDGTFQDYPMDNQFGWYLGDVAIDEANPACAERNDQLKRKSKLTRQLTRSLNALPEAVATTDDLEESCEALETLVSESRPIRKIDPNIHEERPVTSQLLPHTVEGLTDNFYKHKMPSKEQFVSLVNPVNAETKALLSVISYGSYRRLDDRKTKRHLTKNIDFKATNARQIVDFRLTKDPDDARDGQQVLMRELRNYHATKESNMLSLMTELLNTDFDGNLEDFRDTASSGDASNNNGATMETSDLGNSIHSSIASKEGAVKKTPTNRADVLNSIGLGFDIDRSIASFREEKVEMRAQLNEIKADLERIDRRATAVLDDATRLEYDLKETAYLDNLIHLLNGDLDKVKRARLPFRMFQRSVDDNDANYIV